MMSSLTVTPYPSTGHVRVELYSDVVTACAQVQRIGDGSPLRTHVWGCDSLGEWQQLSGGQAVFWDNEAPLDVPYHYEAFFASTVDSSPAVVADSWYRTVANGAGTAPTGQAWTTNGGAASDFNVALANGGQLTIAETTANVNRSLEINATTPYHDQDVLLFFVTPLVATGDSYDVHLWTRRVDGLTYCRAEVTMRTTGVIDLQMSNIVAGVFLTAATGSTSASSVTPYAAGNVIGVRVRAVGNTVTAKVWNASNTAEPDAWTLTATFIGGVGYGTNFGFRAFRRTANTDGGLVIPFNDYFATNIGTQPNLPSIVSDTITLVSNNGMWLRDPVRPCNDVRVTVGKILPKPACDTTSAVYFQSMSDETYAANAGTFMPTNGRRGIPITRTRRDLDSTLTLLTRLFTDRDNVLNLLTPGGALQFVAPAAYGVPDRYFQANDVAVTRVYTDHRKQLRDIAIPHLKVDRPIGPAQGVCGSRITDLCAIYPSWGGLIVSGMSYTDLERGKAGAGFTETATWNSVKAGFANWTAVAAKTWNQIRTGT